MNLETHGGKITCHKCNGFIVEGEDWFADCPDGNSTYFHAKCYNRYEHYYGLDRPID